MAWVTANDELAAALDARDSRRLGRIYDRFAFDALVLSYLRM